MAVGDTNLFFNRDTKVYAVQSTGTTTANVWELPVLNGYSFSQSTNASQVTVNEMASATGNSRRGQASFNDSLAPAEWSFDMYARPTLASSVVRAPEELLWHSMFAETVLYPAAGLAAGIPYGNAGAAFNAAVGSTPAYIRVTFTTPAPTGGTYFKVGDSISVSGVTYTGSSPAVTGTNTFVVISTTASTVDYAAPPGTTAVTAASGGIVASTTFVSTGSLLDFTTASSNKTRLGTFDLYFVLGAAKAGGTAHTYTASDVTTIYEIENCCVNEATVNFDIDGITTISFSGMGTKITEKDAWTFTGTASNPGETASTVYTLNTAGTTSTTNMIRNRITALDIVGTNAGINSGNAKTYGITLTGGSITISNNMTYLTPEAIGVVNVPLGHVTGTRSVSGNFTCYADEVTNGSIDLYSDLISTTSLITNKFALDFSIGGRSGNGSPTVQFSMGQAHLEIPNINIDDLIGFEVNFTALPSTISGANELTRIRYIDK